MEQRGIDPSTGGVYFGQLLGMADNLTYGLGKAGYKAYKYVPYGPVHEVMPYLIRRAQVRLDTHYRATIIIMFTFSVSSVFSVSVCWCVGVSVCQSVARLTFNLAEKRISSLLAIQT